MLDKYLRVSAVSSFFKAPDFIEYIEAVKEKRVRTQQRKSAFKIGSRVDELIKTKQFPDKKDSQEVHNAFASFLTWKVNYNPQKVVPAVRGKNDVLGITGEPDLYIDDIEMCDLKCATAIRLEYWIQQGGYLFLPENQHIKRVSILRLGKKDCEYEYIVKDKPEQLHEMKMLFIGELNKVRAYLKQEEEYDRAELYHVGSVGVVEPEVGDLDGV